MCIAVLIEINRESDIKHWNKHKHHVLKPTLTIQVCTQCNSPKTAVHSDYCMFL